MSGGTLARCPNVSCGRLLIYGQTCTCGVVSHTGKPRAEPGVFECGEHLNRHYISDDGNWWMGITWMTGESVRYRCRRRW